MQGVERRSTGDHAVGRERRREPEQHGACDKQRECCHAKCRSERDVQQAPRPTAQGAVACDCQRRQKREHHNRGGHRQHERKKDDQIEHVRHRRIGADAEHPRD